MLCDYCKKEEATIHLTEIIQDERNEIHLCEACASKTGLNSSLSGFTISLSDVLSFLNLDDRTDETETPGASPVCPVCGTSYSSYAKRGKVGCADCYASLSGPLSSVIKGYHEDRKHCGKIPEYRGCVQEREKVQASEEKYEHPDELESLLREAVEAECYEEAAVLRDRINLMKQEAGH